MKTLSQWKDQLASLYGLCMLSRRTNSVQYVFMIGHAQDNLAEGARERGEMRDPFDDAALEALWQERYCPRRYDLDDLLSLGPSTLGGLYARHMKERGMHPDFYDNVAPRHKLHYLRLRVRQTHDIWHTLTGFDTQPAGEVGLQGFYFAQYTNGQSALILVAAILKSVLARRYGELEPFVDAFCTGYHNGRRAKPLLGVKWEQLWLEPVAELRRRLGIETAA